MASLRIATVNFKISPISSFDDFADHVVRLADMTANETPDIIVYPELLTLELMFLEKDAEEIPQKIIKLTRFTEDYLALFTRLAREKACYIVGGSHLKAVQGKYLNTGHLFTPDGRVFEQPKCHLIPFEKGYTSPGSTISVFETEKAKISILTCYDIEFPETARLAALQGAEILISPSATFDNHGFWRVRHCAQARCIEDQVYAVHSCLVGAISGISLGGRSSILTPCDSGFPAKGIAAESQYNEEMVITAEVDTERLHEIRENGSAPTLKDVRPDLIETVHRVSKATHKKNG